jgi:hypothetical protein
MRRVLRGAASPSYLAPLSVTRPLHFASDLQTAGDIAGVESRGRSLVLTEAGGRSASVHMFVLTACGKTLPARSELVSTEGGMARVGCNP